MSEGDEFVAKFGQTFTGYQTFDDLTFAERTFADFWGRTFGTSTFGDQHKDIW